MSPAHNPPQRRKKVLLTIQGGGFGWQSQAIARGLSEHFDLCFVSSDGIDTIRSWDLPSAEVYHIPSISTVATPKLISRVSNLLRTSWHAYQVLQRSRPDAVVCIASSIAVPLCFWARFMRVTTVFVESITRVSDPSQTGRILSRLRLCDRIYVQWPEAVKLYRNAIYRGTVL